MTEEEINIAVAEMCGWVWDFNDSKEVRWLNKAKPFRAYPSPPVYVADNAMREALLTLTPADQDRYAAVLSQIVDGRRIDLGATRIETTTKVLFASARHQAQAFLIIRGKWRDT